MKVYWLVGAFVGVTAVEVETTIVGDEGGAVSGFGEGGVVAGVLEDRGLETVIFDHFFMVGLDSLLEVFGGLGMAKVLLGRLAFFSFLFGLKNVFSEAGVCFIEVVERVV